MATKVAVYLGIGKYNKGHVTAFSSLAMSRGEIGEITGNEGYEVIRLADSLMDLADVPDLEGFIEKRREELVQAEQMRHAKRMAELNSLSAA